MTSRGTRRPAGGRVPLLAASGLAVLALVGCGGSGHGASTAPSGAAASPGATTVRTDFIAGVPLRWEARRATVEHASGAAGPAGWVRIDATGASAYVSLPTVENSAGEHHADLFVDARSGRCRVDLRSDDTALSRARCDDAAWHRMTMAGDYGSDTYTLRWTLDGVAMPPISSAGQPTATVHRIWLGDASPAKTNVTDWTDVTLALR